MAEGGDIPTRTFLDTYKPDFMVSDYPFAKPHELPSLVTPENPRILGMLRFKINKTADVFPDHMPPKTFSQLWLMAHAGAISCTNGNQIKQFERDWNTSPMSNKEAEVALQHSSPKEHPDEGTFAIFPLGIHQKDTNYPVPEIILLDTKNCLSPTEPTSTRLFNTAIVKYRLVEPGDSVCDMCSGSGITSIIAGYMKAKEIHALDIIPETIKTTQENALFHHMEHVIQPHVSDLFSAVPEKKYDKIFINPPFNPKDTPRDDRLKGAVHDEEHTVLAQFFQQAKDHLTPGGKIYILYEDIPLPQFDGKNAIEWLSDANGYQKKEILKIKRARKPTPAEPKQYTTFTVYELS